MRECPKGCGWTGVKLERHLEVHHDVEPKSQAMAKLKANSKALSREEQSRKWRAEEETSCAFSKKKKRKETRHVRVNKNTMTLLKRANKIRKKLSIVLMSSSESEQEDGEADEIVETVDRQSVHSDSAPSADEGEVSDGIYGQNDGTEDDNEEEENPDDDKKAENLGRYGPSSRPTNVFETLLRGWNIHLATPDGSEKTPAMIRQMCHHVATIAN